MESIGDKNVVNFRLLGGLSSLRQYNIYEALFTQYANEPSVLIQIGETLHWILPRCESRPWTVNLVDNLELARLGFDFDPGTKQPVVDWTRRPYRLSRHHTSGKQDKQRGTSQYYRALGTDHG